MKSSDRTRLMPLRPLTRDEVREVDRRAIEDLGLPGIVLMENAGRGAAELLIQLGIDGPVTIVAGKGNNGGDGFVIARHLANHGIDVRVLLFADPHELAGDALTNYRVLCASGLSTRNCAEGGSADWDGVLRSGSWIVDSLLGTGTQGTVREPFATVIEQINAAGVAVFAVDLPSGLDCDTGQPLGPCVRAAHTATFVAPKHGFGAPGAAAYTGTVHVIDIGVPQSMLQAFALPEIGEPSVD
ncbi:MAG TPA: NAD(P)H-hydrate epimerase [Planctomycetaceae bacterium]|jgi:NAD(P)H-hydrate epimerase|nr:NAD(P)H-hydrate epimerase [Planctomycetaceae bacterium]